MIALKQNKIKNLVYVICFVLLFVIVPFLSLAQFNPEINYQGKLTNSSGSAVTDGDYNMRFWLIASSTAATTSAVWSEEHIGANKVQVNNGLFSVMLGSLDSLSGVDFNQTLYLGVEIGGTGSPAWDGEMSPRKILGTVPSAFVAEDANTLAGLATTSFLRADEIDTMQATSSSALLTLIQNGAGKIMSLFSGVTEVFTALSNGNIGIATTTPSSKLTVIGNTYLGGNLSLTGSYSDSVNATGTSGQILSSTGTSTQWKSTSALGLGDGTFLGLSDTQNSFTANRLIFTNSGATALTDSANLVFDGTNLGIGTTTPGSALTVSGNISVYDRLTLNDTDFNSALGYQAGKNIVSGAQRNTFLGYQAGYSSSTVSTNLADNNVGIGYRSLYSNTTGYQNTAIGGDALSANTSGVNNTSVGKTSLYSNTSGSYNTSSGFYSMFSNTTGTDNAANGSYSLYSNTTGNSNTALGNYSLRYNIAATSSVAVGLNAARGTNNYQNQGGVYVGYQAGYSASSSSDYNTMIGYQSGYGVTTGARNILLGYNAGYSGTNLTTGSDNIIIGNNIGATSTSMSKGLNIGNLIFGTSLDGTGTTLSTGNVGIGTSTPIGRLEVANNTNGGNVSYLSNPNTGTGAYSELNIRNANTSDTYSDGLRILTLGTGWTTIGAFVQDGSALMSGSNLGGGMSLATLNASANMRFYTGGFNDANERMRITSGGLVGIGTTSPVTTFAVNGSTTITSNLQVNGGTLFADATNNRVGIGTTTPSVALTVSGNISVYDRLTLNDTDSNSALGYQAGKNLVSDAQYNTFLGYQAGFSSSTASTNLADNNTAIGYQALYSNTTGFYNTAIGSQSMNSNTAGSFNVALGSGASYSNTAGLGNVAIGLSSLYRNTTGISNTAIGYQSSYNNTIASSSVAIGYRAAVGLSSYQNQGGVYVGYQAGYSASSSSDYNTMIGYQSGYGVTTGANNILLGYQAGYSGTNLTTGSDNIIIGNNIDATSTSMSKGLNIGNLIFGTSLDGTGTTLSSGNIGIGTSTPSHKLTVIGNTYLGGNLSLTGSLSDSVTATGTSGQILSSTGTSTLWTSASGLGLGDGTFLGLSDTQNSFTANRLIFTNSGATALTDSANLVFDGTNFGIGSTTPSSKLTVAGSVDITNTATSSAAITLRDTIGGISMELRAGTSTLLNTFVGVDAGKTNTTGSQNTSNGYKALYSNTTGSDNSIYGFRALYNNTTGSNNTALGSSAGRYIANGATGNDTSSNSLYLGYNTKALADGDTNEIVIGYTAVGAGSNSVTLGSTTITTTILQGNIGIGTTTPSNKLTVYGDINISDSSQGYKINNNRILYASTTNFSTLVGNGAGQALLSDGSYNTAFGYQSLYTATSSDNNTAVGYGSLYSNTTGSNNTAIGRNSLYTNTTGSNNTAIGRNSLYTNTTGSNNTATGLSALNLNTTGSYNTANGFNALAANTTGSNNTAIGQGAGRFLTDGTSAASTTDNSLFLGYNTKALTDNDQNAIIIGYDTNGLGSNTVVLGNDSIVTTALKGNVGIGTTTPSVALTVSGNISVYDRLTLNDTDFNSALGYQAGKNVASGAQYNTFLGYQAGYSSSTASTNAADYNTAIGFQSLYSNTTGNSNAALGFQSLNSNTSGTGNVANGFNALYYNTTGGGNTASGYLSLHRNTSGMGNTGFGAYSLLNNATGSYNTAIGIDSLYYNTNASGTVALGYGTAWGTGDYNNQGGVYVGYGAGYSASSSSDYNTMIGYRSGYGVTTGARNILLGYNAGYSGTNLTTGSDNIIIGNNIGATSTAMTKGLNIGNLIFGTSLDGTGTTLSSGNVGIGTSTPVSRLSIEKLSYSSAGTAGINQYFTFNNSVASAVQYGNFGYLYATNTATTTIAGNMFKIEDSTLFGNTIRGFEVQTDRGTNTLGENTALSGFARTFGVRGTTQGDAGGTYEPAGVFGETAGTTQGNAIRAYSSSITTASLLKLFQASSTFAGTGLLMNFGNSGGSFSSTTASKFIDLQNAGTSMFTVGAYGKLTIGDGTTNNNAGIQVGYGGICVDNDGSCNASTTGRVSAVSYHTGNSDLAEMYFSGESLKTGEVVYVKGGLSVGKADNENKDKIIGVVSTKPGQVLGFDDTSLKINEKGYPIALAGRVPVRLSNENGAIKAGDELMLSSIPGVVMKASSTGKIIGTALEDFNETRAYSDTYINQFGDDLVDPVFIPINKDKDPRINDGCYFGGGNASGEEPCVPLKSLTKDEQIKEAEAIAKREAEERELAKLAKISSESIALENGKEVKVGQIVMFVDLRQRYLDEVGAEMVTAMTAKASTTKANEVGEETVWQRVVNLANNFVDGVLSVFTLKADRVEVKDQLCVDGVCLNADDLRNLLKNKEINQSVDGNQSNTLDEEDKNINPDNNNNSSSANSEEDTFTETEEGNELDTNNENTIEEDSYKASEVLLDSEPLPSESVESTDIKSSEETPA